MSEFGNVEFVNDDRTGIIPIEAAHPETTSATSDWRHGKWLILVELLVVALIIVADAKHYISLSKTPFLLVFGWISACTQTKLARRRAEPL